MKMHSITNDLIIIKYKIYEFYVHKIIIELENFPMLLYDFFSASYLMFARRFPLNPLQLIHCVT